MNVILTGNITWEVSLDWHAGGTDPALRKPSRLAADGRRAWALLDYLTRDEFQSGSLLDAARMDVGDGHADGDALLGGDGGRAFRNLLGTIVAGGQY